MNSNTAFESPANLDMIALERKVRKMRAVETARLARALRDWVSQKLAGFAVTGGKTA